MNIGATSSKTATRLGSLWYFVANGLTLATAIVAFANVPRSLAFVPLVATVLLIAAIDFITRKASIVPLSGAFHGAEVAYLVILGLVVIGSLIVVRILGQNGEATILPWLLAVVVFFTVLAGWWITNVRSTHRSSSAS